MAWVQFAIDSSEFIAAAQAMITIGCSAALNIIFLMLAMRLYRVGLILFAFAYSKDNPVN